MIAGDQSMERRGPFRVPWMLGVCLFLLIAVFFLWQEHRAHLFGALPYLLVLMCPLIHLFIHRGHAGHHGAPHPDDDRGAS